MTLCEREYISMKQAADISPYEQGYLSLLARRRLLKAAKIDGKWFTKVEWLNEYLDKMKPEKFIDASDYQRILPSAHNSHDFLKILSGSGNKKSFHWRIGLSVAVLAALVLVLGTIFKKLDQIEKENVAKQFTPQELIQIPNDEGGYDVYGIGSMKLKEEKSSQVSDFQISGSGTKINFQ